MSEIDIKGLRERAEAARKANACYQCNCIACGREGLGELHDHVCTGNEGCKKTVPTLDARRRSLQYRLHQLGVDALALLDRLESAERPEMFWSYDDPEIVFESPSEAMAEAGHTDEVFRVMTGKMLGDAWTANRVLTVDDEGDPDETEVALFGNEQDALRCWPDSLSAARAAETHIKKYGSADHD